MKELIHSNANKIIKQIKALQHKKFRDEQGCFIIEGEKLLMEALEYDAPIKMVLLGESFSDIGQGEELVSAVRSKSIPVYYADDKVFKEAGETETPQGVIAVVEKPDYSLYSILQKKELCIVILHEIRDPGNAGTIIRTADACGLDAVILSKGSVDIYNGKTIRSTMGSLFHIPVLQNIDTLEIAELCRREGIFTIGADPHSDRNCIELLDHTRQAVIIGNESQGLGKKVMEALDVNAKIPMPGRAESLNAGIAASILMYELAIRKKHVK